MPEPMTPGRARVLGERWELPAVVFLGLTIAFVVLSLGNLAWLCFALTLACVQRVTEHRAWRRGYLDGAQERRAARTAGGRRG